MEEEEEDGRKEVRMGNEEDEEAEEDEEDEDKNEDKNEGGKVNRKNGGQGGVCGEQDCVCYLWHLRQRCCLCPCCCSKG